MTKKRWQKNLLIGTFSVAALLGGVSAYGLYELEKINTEEFANSVVKFKGKKIPLQDFYENVEYRNDHWVYINPEENKLYNLDVITDFVHRGIRKAGEEWRAIQGHRYCRVDTVYYMKVENDSLATEDAAPTFLFRRKDSNEYISNMPALGKNFPHGKVITQYEPVDESDRDRSIEQQNDSINCTSDHEDQHEASKDPGPDLDHSTAIEQIGQSYELTFAETCWNEIISNISQFLKQRENYLLSGRDPEKFSNRFQFYPQAVEEGLFNPQLFAKISPKELDFIGNKVMDVWMEKRFPIYHHKNMTRTLTIHSTKYSNYNSVQENLPKHITVLANKLIIKGYNFFPYLYSREKEILAGITDEDKKIFAQKVAEKRKHQTHLGDLEWTRMSEGQEAYEERIRRNVQAAQANKIIRETKNCIKHPWLFLQKYLGQAM